jgi:hypothetical protein
MSVQISRNLFANVAKYLSALLVGLVLGFGSGQAVSAEPTGSVPPKLMQDAAPTPLFST